MGERIAKGQDAKLTFVCTHNSRRSHLTQIWTQIAAAHFGVNHVQTFSGGTEVTACNPRTVAALKRSGLRFSITEESSSNPHYAVAFSDMEPPLICFSKVFNRPPNPSSNYWPVMTCSHADQNCPVAIGCDLRLAIRYEDPKVSDDTPQEAATYDERCAQNGSRNVVRSVASERLTTSAERFRKTICFVPSCFGGGSGAMYKTEDGALAV